MTPIRCPRCEKLLGYFHGMGEIQCPRCRKGTTVVFNTGIREIYIKEERQERR